MAQITTSSTKLITLDFLDEEFAMNMLIDGCEFIPSSVDEKKRKKKKHPV